MSFFRPGTREQAMNAIDALRQKQPLEGHPRVDLQQTNILQSAPLMFRSDPCERFTNPLPVELNADIVAMGMRDGAADEEFAEAGTYFYFQGGATAEVFMP